MDFDLSDEQRQLKDSVERLLADTYADLAKRMGYMKEPKGYSAALWKQYADLGLLAVPFAEEHGGLGQGLTETMIIAEAFGRGLVIEPYFATVVLAGGTLANLGASSTYGSWRFDNAGDVLSVTQNSTVSAVNVKFANGGALNVAAGRTLTFTVRVAALRSSGGGA